MKLTMVPVPFLFLATSFAADLQNPDFELPPPNLPGDSNALVVLFNENNTIPGWTFEGNVEYITSGSTVALPGNGHAVQLDRDGKINQTFTSNGEFMQYLLTFTLAMSAHNCSSAATLIVSAPDTSAKFSLKDKYGKETRESYGYQLGSWGSGESINLVFQSQAIIDMLRLKTIGQISESRGNLLANGGFELGPDFLDDSSEGILLDPEASPVKSALQQWSVLGTVKYIDSKHYFVPEGSASIEIVSGVSAGIQTSIKLKEGSNYNLKFMLGDANDSCMGDFVVGVQAGSAAQNFSLQSNGTGSAKKFSLNFKGESIATPITFQSYSTSLSKGGLYCGPVIDDVVLSASARTNPYTHSAFLLLALLLLATCLPKDETLRCGHVI